jgi:hypothetical protein
VTNPELAVLRLHGCSVDMRLAKALAFPDDSDHPDCLAALPLVLAGPARLVFDGAAEDLDGLASRSPGTAVLTLEPVAHQVKGEFADLRTSLGRRLGIINVRGPIAPAHRFRASGSGALGVGPAGCPGLAAEGEGGD